MKRKPTYHSDLMRDLKDPKTAIGYLNAALEDSDRRVFLLALRHVAEAWGGMTKISRATKIPRITLYKILSKQGNPEIQNLDNLLKAFKMRLLIAPIHLLKRAA